MTERPILLVEDNPDDAMLTVRAFTKNRIRNEVVVATDGEQALRTLLPEQGEGLRPALVLLDIKLPKVGGIDVLRRIRAEESTKHLPVVMLTSSSEDEDIIRSYESGANSYVRKPVDFGDFANAVQRLGLYWLLVNSVPALD